MIAGSIGLGLSTIAVRIVSGGSLTVRLLEGATLLLAALAYLFYVLAHHSQVGQVVTRLILSSSSSPTSPSCSRQPDESRGVSTPFLVHDDPVVSSPERTPYEQLGGSPFFARLVDTFYAGVEDDPVLRPLYPGSDLGPAAERLRLFLEQYWGGPTTYSDTRGHPRLRMRHRPFAIDGAAREHWLAHMRAALDKQALKPELDALLWSYFESAADAMVNTPSGNEIGHIHAPS